jgi:eukaryotic-like serine/threonine-protein kinase
MLEIKKIEEDQRNPFIHHVWQRPSPARMPRFCGLAALPSIQMASVFTENLVGHVLDQRYALNDLVGVGGSARVYRAEDRRLRRMVAVKVLHASFADDEGFVRRFRQEAEALAPLSHPNIVTVFDVNDGENASGEPPFLVTEYLAGGTLRELLDNGHRLTPSQATRIGLDAARGLAFAHARDLVHRDIKPANLIFGDDQRIRIADFGLARALADSGRTEHDGAPIGTARYLSPEQAAGTPADGRSDVYSLALVLVEAVTGVVPFTAETRDGSSHLRRQKSIEAPFELGPLGSVVEAAGKLNPADRLDSTGLVHALEEIAKTLPKAEPFSLDGSRLASKADLIDRDPTRHAKLGSAKSTVKINVLDPARLSTVPLADSAANKAAKKTGIFDLALDEDHLDKSAAKSATSNDSPLAATEKTKQSRWKIPATIFTVLALGAGGGGFAYSQRVPTHLVPKLKGKTIADARKATLALRFEVNQTDAIFSDVPKGQIIDQTPAVGERIAEKKIISVTVSKGAEPIAVPDLTGLTQDTATGTLRALRLRVGAFPLTETSVTVEAGKVIRWTPIGEVAPDTEISLVISAGLPTIAVPKFAGLTEAEIAAVAGSDLLVTIVKAASDAPKGTVFGSEPKAETVVNRGSEVKIFVSTGPAFATVPNIIGLLPGEASVRLRAAGFRIGNTIGPADQPVLHTRPLRNTRVKRNTVVTLYTTDSEVPEVPGVEQTRTTRKPTTKPVVAQEIPTTTETPSTAERTAATEDTKPPTSKPATSKPANSKPKSSKPKTTKAEGETSSTKA